MHPDILWKMEKQKIQEKKQAIFSLIEAFCKEKLDEEYLELTERLINKLARKRNVPFITGKEEIWAASIIHAIGSVNFLFDSSFEPYVSVKDISDYFGIGKSTFTNKSKQIRDMLKINMFNAEFSTQVMQENNPLMDYVMVNGMIYPISALPEEYQKLVREAKARGKDISFTFKLK